MWGIKTRVPDRNWHPGTPFCLNSKMLDGYAVLNNRNKVYALLLSPISQVVNLCCGGNIDRPGGGACRTKFVQTNTSSSLYPYFDTRWKPTLVRD